jgi:hypothetical protein
MFVTIALKESGLPISSRESNFVKLDILLEIALAIASVYVLTSSLKMGCL